MMKSNLPPNEHSGLNQLKSKVLASCQVDWTGLWVLPHFLRDEVALEDEDTVRKLSLQAIRELAEQGSIEIGDVNWDQECFEEWGIPVDDAIERIEREWSELGREPGMDEICWLSIPGGEAPLATSDEQARGNR